MEHLAETMTPEETQAMEAMAQDTAPIEDEPEAAPEPEIKAEQKAEAELEAEQAADDPAKPPKGFVPQQALHAEREKRKSLEATVAELQAAVEAIRNPPAPAPQEVDMPDPILKPDEFKAWQRDQVKALADKIEQQQQAQAMNQRVQAAAQLEQQFQAKTPDYPQAVQFLISNRQAELRAYGYNDAAIKATLAQDANAIFDTAMGQGRNPAEIMYEAAKLRGYGVQAAPPMTAQPDQTARINALAAAQANTGSLSQAGGPSQSGTVTLAQIARMSEAEIAAFSKSNPVAYRKAVGG